MCDNPRPTLCSSFPPPTMMTQHTDQIEVADWGVVEHVLIAGWRVMKLSSSFSSVFPSPPTCRGEKQNSIRHRQKYSSTTLSVSLRVKEKQ